MYQDPEWQKQQDIQEEMQHMVDSVLNTDRIPDDDDDHDPPVIEEVD